MADETEVETMPMPGGGAMQLVAQGHAVIKIENDSMMQVAVTRPRDEAKVLAGCLKELELVPEEAASAFYSIPYRERQSDGSVKIVNVTGPSIDAAMALARRWGNATAGGRILSQDSEGYDVEGVFIDLETNFRIARPFRVSKWYKPKGRGRAAELLSVDRQLTALQAGVSKAIRNAIVAGLPAYLVNAYDKKARTIAGGKQDAPAERKTVDAVVKAFDKWGVTQSQLEAYVEDIPVEKWTGTEVATLRGLWNAIHDKQTTVAEVWPPVSDTGQQQTHAGAATPDSLMSGATVTGQDGQSPGAVRAGDDPAALEAARGALIPLAQKTKYVEVDRKRGSIMCLNVADFDFAAALGAQPGLLPIHDLTLRQVEIAIGWLEAVEKKMGGAA